LLKVGEGHPAASLSVPSLIHLQNTRWEVLCEVQDRVLRDVRISGLKIGGEACLPYRAEPAVELQQQLIALNNTMAHLLAGSVKSRTAATQRLAMRVAFMGDLS
jgi:hypothetical protein